MGGAAAIVQAIASLLWHWRFVLDLADPERTAAVSGSAVKVTCSARVWNSVEWVVQDREHSTTLSGSLLGSTSGYGLRRKSRRWRCWLAVVIAPLGTSIQSAAHPGRASTLSPPMSCASSQTERRRAMIRLEGGVDVV